MAHLSDYFTRDEYPLADIRILSRAQGLEYADGRTVEALVAVFDRETPISDPQGQYLESVSHGAFDKAINDARPQGSRSTWKVGVFYNHGLNLHGGPSDRGTVPIGSPVDIRADAAGLLTVTRYNQTSLAEEVLETIRAGDITGHSFSGRFVKSDPAHPPRAGFRPNARGELTVVRRLELGLREYGPTPFPAYADTAVLSVRTITPATPDEEEPPGADTPEPGAVADEPPETELSRHSSRSLTRNAIEQKIALARRIRPGLARAKDEAP